MPDFPDANAPFDDTSDDTSHADDDAGMDATGMDAGEAHAAQPADPEPAPGSREATEPPEDEVEGAVPPGYDWPTHGGYLGCLVGTIAACLVTGFFGANLFSYFYIALHWPFPIFALLTFALFVVAIVGFGRLGWRLGRRFYRYYPQAKSTWGEDDAASAELAHVRPARQRASGQGTRTAKPKDDAAEGIEGAATADEDSTAQLDTAEALMDQADQAEQREALVEGREGQDDGGDGSGEAADEAEDADQEPQRP